MTEQFYDESMARVQEEITATPDLIAQRRTMLDLLALKEGEHVLDVGSGNGIFVREMLAIIGENGHVCGVDSSEPLLNMARGICPKGVFLKGDATDLPVEDLTYDVVTASQVLCFINDAAKAISEMYRVLKPGGRLVVLDSDWASLVWNCRNQELMDRVIKMLTGPYADSHVPRTLSRHLIDIGFKITGRHSFTVLNWEPDLDSYSQQTVGFIKPMMEASSDFTKEDWEAWDADQKSTAKAGEYMFSLNRYIFIAVKP